MVIVIRSIVQIRHLWKQSVIFKLLLFLCVLSALVAGCKTEKDRQNACAEINSTRVIESSKRMDILKSYGYTPLVMGTQRWKLRLWNSR